jgi:arginine deiminase
MTLLSVLETYVFNLEQSVQRLQQESQLLKQTLQEKTTEIQTLKQDLKESQLSDVERRSLKHKTKGLNLKKDNKK